MVAVSTRCSDQSSMVQPAIQPIQSSSQSVPSSHRSSRSIRSSHPSIRCSQSSGAHTTHSQREFGAIRAVHSHLPRFPRYLPQQVQWAGREMHPALHSRPTGQLCVRVPSGACVGSKVPKKHGLTDYCLIDPDGHGVFCAVGWHGETAIRENNDKVRPSSDAKDDFLADRGRCPDRLSSSTGGRQGRIGGARTG